MLDDVKTVCEIFALCFGGLFVGLKILGGQYNYGMEVVLEAERIKTTERNDVVLKINLKRPDTGRIEIRQIQVEVWPNSSPQQRETHLVPHSQIMERQLDGQGWLSNRESNLPVALPPGDGTQIVHVFPALADELLVCDTTILGRRRFIPFLLTAQWRASCIVKPS